MTSMSKHKSRRAFRRLAITGMASGAALLMAAPAYSVDFRWGGISGSLDNQISVGTSVRLSDPDSDNMSQAEQAGRSIGDDQWPDGGGDFPTGNFTNTGDDGQLNYEGGDIFSAALRTVHEVDVTWSNFGGFVRGNFFYDPVNTGFKETALAHYPDGEDGFVDPIPAYSPDQRGDHSRPKNVEDRVGNRARLLDAYVYGDFDVAGRFVNVRLGRQVLSWGESTFIQNGINVATPIDLTSFRVAGSELRDAFLPENMLYVQADLFGNTSAEAFVQFEWSPYELDPRGTLFGNDILETDGRALVLGSGRYTKQDAMNVYDMSDPDTQAALVAAGFDLSNPTNQVAFGSPFYQPMLKTEEASDSGQFGIAIRQFLPELASTELGFYFLNVHHRTPVLSWNKAGGTNFEDVRNANLAEALEAWDADNQGGMPYGSIVVEYPEDQQVFGISMNTFLPTGTSMGGEISFKPDVPLQIHQLELIAAALPNAFGPNGPTSSQVDGATGFGAGERIQGYIERDVTQLQATAIHAFGPANPFNASQWAVVGEIGGTYVHDLPEKSGDLETDGLRLATPESPSIKGGNQVTPVNAPDKWFADDFSWGYRVVTQLEYNNAIGAWNARPQLAFNHDVQGNSPQGYNFLHNRKSATLGVTFDYLSRWEVGMSYATFWGGYGNGTTQRDKDFVSATVNYSF